MQKSLYSSHNDVLRRLLRRARSDARLRQADLAHRLGRGQATVSKVERGERRLDVIELRAWLRALEVDFLGFMAELNETLMVYPGVDPHLQARRRSRGQRRTERSQIRPCCD
ncbi:MAG TPA: helix-turn-helix transcriptional regulator [Ramlibacter sp.]|nr:helix-turn-helix transcriptional regulator [Ramlibacter sp.]